MSELKNFNRMFSLEGKVALVTGGESYVFRIDVRILTS